MTHLMFVELSIVYLLQDDYSFTMPSSWKLTDLPGYLSWFWFRSLFICHAANGIMIPIDYLEDRPTDREQLEFLGTKKPKL